MESLIKREEQQPTLPGDWSPEVLERIEAEESRGTFTGDRLFLRKPEIYRAVTQLLGQGVGVRQIARTLGISTNTVAAVRSREGSSIETHKIRAVESLSAFVAAASERLRDEIDEIDIEKLAVPLGIAAEKLMLLTGQATSRVEHIEAAPAPIDFGQYLQSIPEARVAQVETGLSGGTLEQKGVGAPGAEVAELGGIAAEFDQGNGARPADLDNTENPQNYGAGDLQSGVCPSTHTKATGETTAGGRKADTLDRMDGLDGIQAGEGQGDGKPGGKKRGGRGSAESFGGRVRGWDAGSGV